MDNTLINPTIHFYKSYEKNIFDTREALFNDLSRISCEFGNEARLILEAKLKSNNNIPLLGELFPWIIKDLINGDSKMTHSISVGWLAIYLYTLFLDEYLDNPKQLQPEKFLTGSLLASTGLLRISRFTNNTPYEKYIEDALSFSAKNQRLDLLFQSEKVDLNFKESYSEGKNYVILACAGALAAKNSKHSDFIIQFTEKLLLSLQYLDDICDYQKDFIEKNYTVLLSDTFQNRPDFTTTLKTYSNRELLSELIKTGSLRRVLNKLITLLNQSIILINNQSKIDKKASVELFYALKFNCLALSNYLEENQDQFALLPNKSQVVILDKVEKYITIIAQSS
jgi:hypothetical protein